MILAGLQKRLKIELGRRVEWKQLLNYYVLVLCWILQQFGFWLLTSFAVSRRWSQTLSVIESQVSVLVAVCFVCVVLKDKFVSISFTSHEQFCPTSIRDSVTAHCETVPFPATKHTPIIQLLAVTVKWWFPRKNRVVLE